MIDISKKDEVYREATASGEIHLRPNTVQLIKKHKVEKGDPIQIASLGGIQGAKFTPLIMPLCHPLRLESTDIRAELRDFGMKVTATVVATGKTGVEMEALAAVSIALLNIWDVVKMHEKDPQGQYPTTAITNIGVIRKVKNKVETSRRA
jgi:cyclic pyranopterin phosphate synthase